MTTTEPPRALSFDAIAAQYAAARPGYPPALFDAIEEITARPLPDTDALDAGAGTGIATRLLRERGARVTALEPGSGMAARLRAEQPGVPLVRADGNALPFAGSSFDLVTYAQAFHWTDPERAIPEAMRVLRPGGALALWWNQADHTVPWVAGQNARLGFESAPLAATGERAAAALEAGGVAADAGAVMRTVTWSRTVTLDHHLRNVGSHSYFSTLPDRGAAVLSAERAALLERFPGEVVEEPYTCLLLVARRPAALPEAGKGTEQ